MAKTKAVRLDETGGRRNSHEKAPQPARRPSGAQHRKKARIRKTTQPVDGLLDFATAGRWPLGKDGWLTVYEPRPDENGTFNPLVAALHQYVVANLEAFSSENGRASAQPSIDVLAENVYLTEREEAERLNWSDPLLKKLRALWAFCEGQLLYLKDGGRSILVRRCITCRRWFLALKHDPHNRRRPYCGKGCWPKDSFKDPVAVARRVQSKKS